MTPGKLRKEAVKHLNRILFHDAYLNIVSTEISTNSHLSISDKTYLLSTIKGVIIWYKKYQWIISQKSRIPVKKIEREILLYLLCGLQNLLDDTHIPEYSAVNEIVDSVKSRHGRKAVGFVNGILRAVQRDDGKFGFPEIEKDGIAHISVVYSHPEWMVERWIQRYGIENTIYLCEWNNRVSKETTLRVNRLKPDYELFIQYCKENGYFAGELDGLPQFIRVKNASGLINSVWFANGYFTMQSVSSGLSALALAPEEDSTTADLCAAPGGKTALISELMKNSGIVISSDIHLNRLRLVRESAERLGCSNVRLVCGDATSLQLFGTDFVLIDVPCSGLGTIHLKSDIKWKRQPEQNAELTEIQRDILENAARVVKPGGVIVYSTCTIEPEENEQIIEQFLKNNRNFRPEPLPKLPLINMPENDYRVSILPFIHNLDGSFIAKLRRIV